MDKESISRLGLDYISNIDVESSDEIYNPSTTNHIIVLKLIKQTNFVFPHFLIHVKKCQNYAILKGTCITVNKSLLRGFLFGCNFSIIWVVFMSIIFLIPSANLYSRI